MCRRGGSPHVSLIGTPTPSERNYQQKKKEILVRQNRTQKNLLATTATEEKDVIRRSHGTFSVSGPLLLKRVYGGDDGVM